MEFIVKTRFNIGDVIAMGAGKDDTEPHPVIEGLTRAHPIRVAAVGKVQGVFNYCLVHEKSDEMEVITCHEADRHYWRPAL